MTNIDNLPASELLQKQIDYCLRLSRELVSQAYNDSPSAKLNVELGNALQEWSKTAALFRAALEAGSAPVAWRYRAHGGPWELFDHNPFAGGTPGQNEELEPLRPPSASQPARIAELEAERDDADRRAGAAERELSYERKNAYARNAWLDKAKDQWGADRNVSFDVIWAEALDLRAQLAAAEQHGAERMREALSVAFDAEISRVSHVQYDSNEICRHFYVKLCERMDRSALPISPATAADNSENKS